jgi:hypothetical protein
VRVTLLHEVEGGNQENSHIDKNTFDYLKPDKPKVGRFYLLPKIHKVNNPGRPIVSANGHPTEKQDIPLVVL